MNRPHAEQKPLERFPLRWALLRWQWLALTMTVLLLTTFFMVGERLSGLLSWERVLLSRAVTQLSAGASADTKPMLMEAGIALDTVLQKFPSSADATIVLAQFYQRFGFHKDAIRSWNRCMKLDPLSSGMAHEAIGALEFEEGHFDVATNHFQEAFKYDARISAYAIQLGESLLSAGRPDEAARVLEIDIKSHGRSMAACSLLGQASLQLRHYEQSSDQFEAAIKFGPEYPAAHHGLATAYARLGNEQKAAEYRASFEKLQKEKEQRHRNELKADNGVEKLLDQLARTYATLGRVYLVHGDLRTGEAFFLKAKGISATEPECRLLLAQFYEQQGRLHEAIAAFEEACIATKRSPSQQLLIAAALNRLGQFGQAESIHRHVIDSMPQHAAGYASFAQMLLQTGRNLSEAKNVAKQAVEIEPVAEYWFLLGKIFQKIGDREGAMNAFQEAATRDPANNLYRDTIQAMKSVL